MGWFVLRECTCVCVVCEKCAVNMRPPKRKNGRVGSSEIASLLSDVVVAPQNTRRTRTPTTSLQSFGDMISTPSRRGRNSVDNASSNAADDNSDSDGNAAVHQPPEQKRRTSATQRSTSKDELVSIQERQINCQAYIDDLRTLLSKMQRDMQCLEKRRKVLERALEISAESAASSEDSKKLSSSADHTVSDASSSTTTEATNAEEKGTKGSNDESVVKQEPTADGPSSSSSASATNHTDKDTEMN